MMTNRQTKRSKGHSQYWNIRSLLRAENRRLFAFAAVYFITLLYIGLKFHVAGDGDSETDFFATYVPQARSFLAGTVVIDPFRGPVYPIVLGALSLPLGLFGLGLFESGIVLSVLSSTALVVFSYRLFRLFFDSKAAVAAVLLLLLNPVIFRYSYTTGNDMFFAALASITTYLVLAEKCPSWRRVAGIGLIAGVAYLTRYNGIALVLAICLSVVLLGVWHSDLKGRFTSILLCGAAFTSLITLWSFYTLNERGALIYNMNYVNVAVAFHGEGQQTDRFIAEHRGQFGSFLDVIRFDPGQSFLTLAKHIWGHSRFFLGRVVLWPTAVFFVFGIVHLFARRRGKGLASYLLFAIVFFATLLVVFYNDRFYLFLIAPVTIAAVHGLKAVLEFKIPRRLQARGLWFAVGLLMVFSTVSLVRYNKRYFRGESIRFREVAEMFLRSTQVDISGRRVAARKPYFAYFAGLEPLALPVVESQDHLMEYLREQRADYLFFSFFAARTRPPIRRLFDYRKEHAGLTPLVATEIGVLYEVTAGDDSVR